MRKIFASKSKLARRSAKGAKYDSQGQALSGAKRVAPGRRKKIREALKVRNTRSVGFIPLFQSFARLCFRYPGATRLALLGACPWLSYVAPSALHQLNLGFEP